MSKTCYVPNCDTGSKSWKKKGQNLDNRTLFSPPKDDQQRELWAKMIPRVGILKPTDKVCSVHFEEQDIIKGTKFIIENKEVFLPMLKWRLKENALPRLFPSNINF